MAATKTKAPALVIGVDYSGVSNSGLTVRLGVKTGRGNLSLAQADKALAGKRLTVKLLARSAGQSDQESLPGAEADLEVTGIADVKGFGVTARNFTFGLSFVVGQIDLTILDQFPKRAGTVTIVNVEEMPDEGDGDE